MTAPPVTGIRTTTTSPGTVASGLRGTLAGVGLTLLTIGVCTLGPRGLGELAGPAFLIAAMSMGIWMLLRRRWTEYLEFTLWLWLLAPLVRRVVDYSSQFHRLTPVLIAAPLVSLIGILAARHFRVHVYRDAMAAVAVAAAVFGYGVASGIVQVGVSAAANAGLNLFGPLALGVFVLAAPITSSALRDSLTRIAIFGGLIVGGYGIAQFFVLPEWDAEWVIDSGITAVAKVEPEGLRIFGTLNSPGPYALALVALIIFCLAARGVSNILRTVAINVALVSLGLSLIRSGWIALTAAVILLLLTRRLSGSRLLLGVVALLVGLSLIGGPVTDTISTRFNDSVSSGAGDLSLEKRLEFQTSILGSTLRDPFGQGLGSTGTASRLAGEGGDASIVGSFDSGVFETLYTMGTLPGLVLLITTAATVTAGWRRALRLPAYSSFVAALAAAFTGSLLITNMYLGIYGVILWLAIGINGRSRAEQVTF